MRRTRLPLLALPFALVGAAAGWLSSGFLSNPLVEVTLPNKQPLSAIVSALVGAALGLWLGRIGAPEHETDTPRFRARWPLRVRFVLAVELAGAAAGGLIGALSAPSLNRADYGLFSGALDGLICAVAFLPICAFVLAAARRSVRARLGSIVAGVDRRAVWGILFAALGPATLLALIDWPEMRAGGASRPFVALAIAGACAMVTAVVLARDVAAFRQVECAARDARSMESIDPTEGADAPAHASIDLGLGDELQGRLARTDAYRARNRTVALVRGDPASSKHAIRRALARGVASIALLTGILALHARAARPDVELVYDQELCGRQRSGACRAAALAAAEIGEGSASIALHQHACSLGEAESCADASSAHLGGEMGTPDPIAATRFSIQACRLGRRASCPDQASRRPRLLQRDVDAWIERACRDGLSDECAQARLMLRTTEDHDLRVAADECQRGLMMSCETAAAALEATDAQLGAWLRTRACSLGRAWSCFMAGSTYMHAEAGPNASDDRLKRRASELFDEACKMEAGFACCEGAYLHMFGPLSLHDETRSFELYSRAEGAGYGSAGSCNILRLRGIAPNGFTTK